MQHEVIKMLQVQAKFFYEFKMVFFVAIIKKSCLKKLYVRIRGTEDKSDDDGINCVIHPHVKHTYKLSVH